MQWTFEPGHTAASFRCRHMMVTWVQGHFRNVTGRLDFDAEAPERAAVEAEIDCARLCTGEPERDAHLCSDDFLATASHPRMKFASSSVEVRSPHACRVHGFLTLRGVTRPVTLDVEYAGQWETPFWEDGIDKGPMMRAGFRATTVIDRQDFGVKWNSALDRGGVVVGDEVFVTLDVEAIRKK